MNGLKRSFRLTVYVRLAVGVMTLKLTPLRLAKPKPEPTLRPQFSLRLYPRRSMPPGANLAEVPWMTPMAPSDMYRPPSAPVNSKLPSRCAAAMDLAERCAGCAAGRWAGGVAGRGWAAGGVVGRGCCAGGRCCAPASAGTIAASAPTANTTLMRIG